MRWRDSFEQYPDDISKTARAVCLVLWQFCDMEKIAHEAEFGRPLAFVGAYTGTPLDLFGIWLSAQKNVAKLDEAVAGNTARKRLLPGACSFSTLSDHGCNRKRH